MFLMSLTMLGRLALLNTSCCPVLMKLHILQGSKMIDNSPAEEITRTNQHIEEKRPGMFLRMRI